MAKVHTEVTVVMEGTCLPAPRLFLAACRIQDSSGVYATSDVPVSSVFSWYIFTEQLGWGVARMGLLCLGCTCGGDTGFSWRICACPPI